MVGAPFRLHGRDAATGLDCVGLVVAAIRASGRTCELPTGYRLRTGQWPDVDQWAGRNGFRPASGALAPGDVVLSTPGPGQLHMAIVHEDTLKVVEAHAGLRKVVLGAAPAADALVRRWCLALSS